MHESALRSWRRLTALTVLGALWVALPTSVIAVDVTFEPAEGRPGTTVSIPGGVCGYADELDQVWFSDRFVPPSPDGIIDFKPAAAAALTPVGGEPTESGIFNVTAHTFVIPRLPAGEYYLYAACWDASACCVPLAPTFHVLGAPNTSTVGGSGPGSAAAGSSDTTSRFVLMIMAGVGASVLVLNSRRFGRGRS